LQRLVLLACFPARIDKQTFGRILRGIRERDANVVYSLSRKSRRSTSMKDEDTNRALKKIYNPPMVTRISLRPDEAVLGNCKSPSSAGPVGGSCSSVGACRPIGS